MAEETSSTLSNIRGLPEDIPTAAPTSNKRAKLALGNDQDEQQQDDDDIPLLKRQDIWVQNILPFVGVGNYIYVAGVNRRFKELYQSFFHAKTRRDGPAVVNMVSGYARQAAPLTVTFARAAFGSVSCAHYLMDHETNPRALMWLAEKVCDEAAKMGNLKVLQWAREQNKHLHPGMPCAFLWSSITCSLAAKHGHLDVLQWAHANGCPWDERTCNEAAHNGHLEILKWAHNNGAPWDARTCSLAACGGHTDCLAWALEHSCPVDEETCAFAGCGGRLETLQWAHARGLPYDESVAYKAASKGQIEILKWIYEKGFPFDEDACSSAAGNGHLETLQWLHEHNCPWDEDTISEAFRCGQVDTFSYALANGCPFEKDTVIDNAADVAWDINVHECYAILMDIDN